MKNLTERAMLGLPNIRRDLGLETDMQRDMRLMQQGDVMGQTLSQGLPAPIANLSAGILRNIPGITDNVRQLGVQSGMSGLQTESELFDRALAGYDGTKEGQARVVQSLTAINPEYGAMMAQALDQRNAQIEKNDMERDLLKIRELEAENRLTNLGLEKDKLLKQSENEASDLISQDALNNSYIELANATSNPVLKALANNAAVGSLEASEFNTVLNAYNNTVTPERETTIREMTEQLMAQTTDGESVYATREDAEAFAKGIVNGTIKVDVDPVTKTVVQTNLLTGEAIEIKLDSPEVAMNTDFEGETLWSNRELLSGFANTVGAAVDVPLAIVGLEESVDKTRADARQTLNSALSGLRRAFDNDDRLTGVEINKFAEEINLAPRLFDDPALWAERAISVDRTLRNKEGDIRAELDSDNPDNNRRQELLNQRQSIASFRQILGVPDIIDIARVSADNIDSITPNELKFIVDRASRKTLLEYEKNYPEMEDLIAQKLEAIE